MRKLILKMHLSVDGFVGRPNGELEWIFDSMDEPLTRWTVATLSQAGLHIMGRRTFNDMAAYWPASTEPYAQPMNEIPKAVFTRRGVTGAAAADTTAALQDATRSNGQKAPPPDSPHTASWAAAQVLGGDLTDEIARLKLEPGKDILAHGGAGFAQSLVKLGLIDEYRLVVHPVALGRGLPLFPELGAPLPLHLVSATPFPSGAVANIYRPIGGG